MFDMFSGKKSFNIVNNPMDNGVLSMNEYTCWAAFRENPIVFKGISLFINTIGKASISCKENWIQNPFPKITLNSLLRKITLHLMITGSCFLGIDEKRLEVLSSHEVKLSNGIMISKNYNKILTIEYINGMSPLIPALSSIEGYKSISKFMVGIIKNGGRPSGIISYPEGDYHFNQEKNKQEIQKLYEHMGMNGTAAIVSGNLKWENIGALPADLQLLEMKNQFAKEIAAVLNVPLILLGMQDTHLAGYIEARKHFWYDHALPVLQNIIDNINLILEDEILRIIKEEKLETNI